MAQTTVLLREDVDNLGARGDLVKVRAGYARNFLLPRKLAVEATPGNVKQIEAERRALQKRELRERASAEGQAASMRTLALTFDRRVGEHGILYGSVTTMDIAEALREQGFEVDRRRVQLSEPIKEAGEFTASVKLHREVTVEIPITVRPEGGAAAAPATTDETPAPAETTGDASAAATAEAAGDASTESADEAEA